MSITIGKYTFEGPYTNTDYLQDRSGVYAILCRSNGSYNLTDVGESGQVKSRVENHDRKTCWSRNCSRGLSVAVYYTGTESSRLAIEKEIRDAYRPPCGDR